MNRRYKELIFTNHAIERAHQRNVALSAAWATWRHPDSSEYAETKGAWIKKRSWRDRTIEVVVKQNERKEWIVISVWANDIPTKQNTPLIMKIITWLWKKIWYA